ncbi:MAG: DMT family transporter [Desulfobacterium sp.]|nr:DMT family transporter [Desulfobacterium sp.]
METINQGVSISTPPVSFIAKHKGLLPMAALLTAVLLWGASFAAMRIAVKALSPWTVMWIRMATALVLILPFTGKLMPSDYRKGDWMLLIPMVLFQPCLYFLLESYALTFTTSSQAGVISASVPLMVALGAWLILSEPLTRYSLAGLGISITGVVFLTLIEGPSDKAQNPLLGNSLEFIAMACAAINMVIVKKMSLRYSPWTLTAMQVLAGTLFFLPGLPLLLETDTSVWTFDLIAAMVFLGAFVTLGAFGFYNWGMSRIPASKASVYINLVPVNAVLIGWIVLGEALSQGQLIAGAGVICGVWLSQRGEKQR